MRSALAIVVVAGLVAGISVSCNHGAAATAAAAGPVNDVVLTKAEADGLKIKVEPATEQNIDDTVVTSGKVSFDDARVAHVFSPVSGKIVKLNVQLGDRVKKGDVLTVIESPDIGVATSDVTKAKGDLQAAERDLKRQEALLAVRAASQKDYETAKDNYGRAKAEMDRALQKARLLAEGEVVGQTFGLRADIDGEVYMKAAAPGMEVSGQWSGGNPFELFTIGEADKVWVIADIYEMDIPRVKVGSKCAVAVISLSGRTFESSVDWVSSSLSPDTHAGKIRCTFDNKDRLLRPEMFATVRIAVEERKALALPPSAVVHLGEQSVVFVDRGATPEGKERFERLPVTVDEGEGTRWFPVLHGLSQGDKVVVEGAPALSAKL